VGTFRLLGALGGIAALLAMLAIAIVATMWVILLVVRHFPMVGRRHRHARWREDSFNDE